MKTADRRVPRRPAAARAKLVLMTAAIATGASCGVVAERRTSGPRSRDRPRLSRRRLSPCREPVSPRSMPRPRRRSSLRREQGRGRPDRPPSPRPPQPRHRPRGPHPLRRQRPLRHRPRRRRPRAHTDPRRRRPQRPRRRRPRRDQRRRRHQRPRLIPPRAYRFPAKPADSLTGEFAALDARARDPWHQSAAVGKSWS